MNDFLSKAKNTASGLMATAATKVSDSAKGIKPEASDIRRAADFLVDAASKTGAEVGRLGQDALKSDMAKDAAAGAAIGAVIAVPVPIIGPIAGAVVGAGLGVYKNITHGNRSVEDSGVLMQSEPKTITNDIGTAPAEDKFEKLTKLHDLMVKGVLTEEEFASEKKKLLDC